MLKRIALVAMFVFVSAISTVPLTNATPSKLDVSKPTPQGLCYPRGANC
jgi:hypothetical protein